MIKTEKIYFQIILQSVNFPNIKDPLKIRRKRLTSL